MSAAGHEHRARPDALDDPARGRRRPPTATNGPGVSARPGVEDRVAPDRRQEEDVARACSRRTPAAPTIVIDVGDREGADAQQRQVDDRRAVPARAPHDDARRAATEAAHEPSTRRARPAPVRALDDAEHEQRRSTARTGPSRAGRESAGGPARGSRRGGGASRTIAAIPIGMLTRNTRRQSAAVTSRPPSDGPMPAASARDGRRQRDGVRAVLGAERREHEPQRRRDQQRRAERLDDARGDQRRRPTARPRTAPRRS